MPSILYVTGLWSGLADVLCGGSTPRGMPAFIRPLKALGEHGFEVDLLILSAQPLKLNLGVDWLKREQITVITPWLSILGMVGALAGFYGHIRHRLRQKRYDFVYGQGTVGTLGVLAAQQRSIPCGQRLYGISYFLKEFERRRLGRWEKARVFFRHPLHYMAFSLAKSFLLVTNDGTRADTVYQQIGNRDAEFLFWLNGVDAAPAESSRVPTETAAEPILLYPGRIDRFKRQHLAIELLNKLKASQELRLVFVGHDYDTSYRRELDALVDKYGLNERIAFLGPLPYQRLQELYQSSLAVLSFYDVSNLGNVAIEALASGALLISLADGSLDGIVVNSESALLVRDMDEASQALAGILAEPAAAWRIRQAARETAHKHFESWDKRVEREIARIAAAIDTDILEEQGS